MLFLASVRMPGGASMKTTGIGDLLSEFSHCTRYPTMTVNVRPSESGCRPWRRTLLLPHEVELVRFASLAVLALDPFRADVIVVHKADSPLAHVGVLLRVQIAAAHALEHDGLRAGAGFRAHARLIAQ